MQTKPFSVQSPEDIAKQYGGNKQKIAQAMQSGIVDPTAGLLAGMFIDRMRSAQAQEMGQQPTVAQQVMAPPSQPAAPLGSPAAGLGAIAPGGAPAAPAAPAAPPAPMGMASGGLASLPVPDDMFDAGDEYAAGGIVAFADGEKVRDNRSKEELLQIISDPRTPADERAEAARVLRTRDQRYTLDSNVGAAFAKGLPQGLAAEADTTFADPLAAAQRGLKYMVGAPRDERTSYAEEKAAILGRQPAATAKGATAAVAPAPSFQPVVVQDRTKQAAPSFQPVVVQDRTKQAAPSRGLGALAPTAPAAAKPDEMQAYLDALGPRPELSYLKGIDLDRQRKQDMWAALAQLGFGMAASKSPSFLGALGESATAALPGMQKSQAERRAMEREMAKAQYDEQMAARGERGEALKYKTGREDVAAERKLEEDKLKQAMDIAKMGQATQLAVARVYAGMQSGRPLARPDILEVAQAIAEDNGRSRATEADMEKAAKMLGRGGSDKSAALENLAEALKNKDQGGAAVSDVQRRADAILSGGV